MFRLYHYHYYAIHQYTIYISILCQRTHVT